MNAAPGPMIKRGAAWTRGSCRQVSHKTCRPESNPNTHCYKRLLTCPGTSLQTSPRH